METPPRTTEAAAGRPDTSAPTTPQAPVAARRPVPVVDDDPVVGETCAVELRRASNGAYYAAFTVPGGLLVARSRTLAPQETGASEHGRAEVTRALRALGWRPIGPRWVRGHGA